MITRRRYSVAVRIAAGIAANAALSSLLNPATSRRSIVLRCVDVTLASAAATEVGLVRAATIGTTTSIAGQPHDGDDAVANGLVGSVFSVQPLYAATPGYARRGGMPATIGSALRPLGKFDTDKPFLLRPGQELVLRNVGAGVAGALDVTWEWEEVGA
jgi:hypothetical protein